MRVTASPQLQPQPRQLAPAPPHSPRTTTRLRCRPGVCRAEAASVTNAQPQVLKQKIRSLSGTKYGLDRPQETRTSVEQLAQELAQRGEVKDLDMTGSRWKTVYTNAKGTSSGKFGPFIGNVTQVFPEDKRNQYINKVNFNGLFKVDLLADYSKQAGKDRIDMEFVNAKFMLGPFSITRDFPPGYKGHWALKYVDDDIRVFNSNIGSLFILRRADPGEA